MSSTRPHIVLIMADQLRRDCIGSLGPGFATTPNLDALLQESVSFDNAYNSCPLCVPTRTSMYTGMWPHSTGVIVNKGQIPEEYEHAILRSEYETLYERLAEFGYGINHVGVHHCHADRPVQERVDPVIFEAGEAWARRAGELGLAPSMYYAYAMDHVRRNSVPTPNYRNGVPVPAFFPTPRAGMVYDGRPEDTIDGFWADLAVGHIQKLDFSQPQFLETLFWAPHPPHLVPEPYASMYPPGNIPLPDSVGTWYDGQPGTLLLQTCGYLGSCANLEDFRVAWSRYLGLVTFVDHCIGKVVDALKSRGIWDDSLVIFCADHGEMLGSHRLWEKHCHYEEAAHIPLCVKPPAGGVKEPPHSRGEDPPEPQRRSQLAGHIDVAPTICDYAGIPRAPAYQGTSLRPVVEDSQVVIREELCMEYNGDHGRGPHTRAIVGRRAGSLYKLIHTVGDKEELYDLSADPEETTSLIDHGQFQHIVTELRNALKAWGRETGDFIEI